MKTIYTLAGGMPIGRAARPLRLRGVALPASTALAALRRRLAAHPPLPPHLKPSERNNVA